MDTDGVSCCFIIYAGEMSIKVALQSSSSAHTMAYYQTRRTLQQARRYASYSRRAQDVRNTVEMQHGLGDTHWTRRDAP